MARSTSFGQFSKRMAIRAKEIEAGTERTVRQAAVAADTAIVTTTPVETGRAKGNWNVSVGTPDTSVRPDNFDPDGQPTLRRHEGAIARWGLGMSAIFLANGLPYILLLENGSSSAKAPNGMTQYGLDAARAVLKKSRLLG